MNDALNRRRASLYLAAAIAAVSLLVYLPALRNEFVFWDDDRNILNNYHIRTIDGGFLVWALTDMTVSYWQPVNWLTHAIDYSLWGFNPLGHHLTNVILHALNTVIVVLLVIELYSSAQAAPSGGQERNTIGQLDGDVLVAAGMTGMLFGLHPLHVESVAWVTGRPGMLCGLFYMLGVMAYLNYAKQQVTTMKEELRTPFCLDRHYLLSLAMFVLALGSKQMAVSLPVVLLIADWYLFRRMESGKDIVRVLAEKVPFIIIGIITALMAVMGQKASGDLTALESVSLMTRLLVAARALVLYVWKTLLPVNLSPFYPYPGDAALSSLEYPAALVTVCGLTAALFYHRRRKSVKLLFVVWAFFVVTLLPAIGIVKVRSVAMADRYMYLPDIGLFLLVGIASGRLWQEMRPPQRGRGIALACAGFIFLTLALLTVRQIAVWKDSITLWSYVVQKTPYTFVGYHNRGMALLKLGQVDKAIDDFTRGIALQPDAFSTYNNRGLAYKEMGQLENALADFNRSIELRRENPDAYTGRGWLFMISGQYNRALEDFNTAISLKPGGYIAYNNRGMLYQTTGCADLAIGDFTRAVALNPYFAEAYTNRGLSYEQVGRPDMALQDYTAAIEADPSLAKAYNNRGYVQERMGRLGEALADLNEAIRLNPLFAEAYNNRGLVHEDLGRLVEAIADYSRAIELNPDNSTAYSNRAIAYGRVGRHEEASRDFATAARLNPKVAEFYNK